MMNERVKILMWDNTSKNYTGQGNRPVPIVSQTQWLQT